MAKKVDISLREIGEQIDRAEGKLSAAARGITSRVEKNRLAAKIKALKKVKAQVKVICRNSYNITVPTS
jgi:hypothetical protein